MKTHTHMRIGNKCYFAVTNWSVMRTNFIWLRFGPPVYCPALFHPVFCRHVDIRWLSLFGILIDVSFRKAQLKSFIDSYFASI